MRDKYSEEEWTIVAAIPQLIGGTVSSVGFSGLIGTAKEAMSSLKGLMAGHDMFPDNGLIGAIAPHKEDMKAAAEAASAHKEYLKAKIAEHGIKNREDMTSLTMQQLNEALCLVDEREVPQIANEYRQWLFATAERVANAAKEGGFLGIGGTRVSENEEQFLSQLKESLGLENLS